MSILLLLSITIYVVALGWSLLLIRRYGDMRVGFVSVMLGLMAFNQLLKLSPDGLSALYVTNDVLDIAIGGMACLSLHFVSQIFQNAHGQRVRLVENIAAVRETERRMRSIVENVPGAVAIKDSQSRYVFMNQYAAHLLGTTPESGVGKTAGEILGAEDPNLLSGTDARVIETGVAIRELEERWVDPSGLERTLVITKSPLLGSDGNVEFIVVIAFDISNQRRAEAALKDREQRYQDLFDQSPVGVWDEDYSGVKLLIDALQRRGVKDFRRYFVENPRALEKAVDAIKLNDINPSALRIYGAENSKVFFEKQKSAVTANLTGYHLKVIEGLAGNQQEISIDHAVETVDGRPAYIRSNIHVVESDTNPWSRVVSTDQDITKAREAQRALNSAKESAESASRAKTDFLAHMSHELRTPLNAILGFTQIISGELFGELGHEKYKEYSADIMNSGQHLLNMINDILDISKIEAGEAELQEAEIDLEELFRDCITMVGARPDAGDTTLRYEVLPEAPRIRADRRFMSQILINLLTNAAKFTPDEGEAVLKATVSDDGGIKLIVEDTGIGISQEDIPKAMEAFGQVRANSHNAHEGTGLGLTISKRLCELHDGQLLIESKLGVGTVVTVSLPEDRILREVQDHAN